MFGFLSETFFYSNLKEVYSVLLTVHNFINDSFKRGSRKKWPLRGGGVKGSAIREKTAIKLERGWGA